MSNQQEPQEPFAEASQQPEASLPPADGAELAEVEKARADLAELKDKYLRLAAEFDNFRKRTMREKSELVSTASEGVMKALLPVIDDMERAQTVLEGEAPVDREGIRLVFQKMFRTLDSLGLKPMQTAGETFDVDRHESLTQVPAATEDQRGRVVDEIQKGYTLGDKVIRFAKVVVGA